MKKLTIQADSCLISKNGIGDININGESINSLIFNNLPNYMDKYKDYPARVSISIEFLDTNISIDKQGYAKEAKLEEEEEED